MGTLGGAGIPLGLRGQATNAVTLQAGTTYIIPAGNYLLSLGAYTFLQMLDPVTNIWRTVTAGGPDVKLVQSDGANWRLANLTGCAVAAIITNAGATGATTGIGATATAMTVTVSSGASVWVPVVGGAISASFLTGVTGSTVGASYTHNPACIISAPPRGGLQATAHVTGIPTTAALLAAQVIIDNQGAGYGVASTGVAAATITFINDPRDTTGNGATVRVAATGTGQLTGLYPSDHGNPCTVVPTLTFGVGSAAATVVMNFVVTAVTPKMTGVTWATGTNVEIRSVGGMATGPAAGATGVAANWTNPIHEGQATFPRPARIICPQASNVATATGAVIEDAGLGLQVNPGGVGIGQLLAITGVTGSLTPSFSVGGISDTSWLQPV